MAETRPSGAQSSSFDSSLAHALEPALIAACHGRLAPVEWFRSPWQRGGASTGYSRFSLQGGGPGDDAMDVVVKLPVGPVEYRWTTALAGWRDPELAVPPPLDAGVLPPTPRVMAAGRTVAGYDLAWLVMERLPGRPLAQHSEAETFRDLLVAADAFHRRAGLVCAPTPGDAPVHDWAQSIAKAREACRHASLADAQKWNHAIHDVQRRLPALVKRWNDRPINAWCHADLHPNNAMRRADSSCVLIDLALVHAGHWIEDALYLERQYWGRPETFAGLKPVSFLAKLRRERSEIGPEDHTGLANVRRLLAAACVPLLIEREGNPRYAKAALELIERLLPQTA